MLRAINTLTKDHSHANNNLPSAVTPDIFNAHFVSVVSKFLPDDQTVGSQYSCPDKLLNFCSDQTSQNHTFSVPPVSTFTAGITISKMGNKKSTGCDGISVKFKKIVLPYTAETLYVFPIAFKRAEVIPVPKTKTTSTNLNDYRPISFPSVLTKPLKRHINKHSIFFFTNKPSFPFLPVWLPMWTFLSNCGYPFN